MNFDTASDLLIFRKYSDFLGHSHRVTISRRNGRLAPNLAPTCSRFPERETETIPRWEQQRYFVNLNPIERRTWEKILRGRSIRQIAAEEGVRRSAIYARITGNSKGQGGMIAKNFWVLYWWLCRQALLPQTHA
jgi:hypothetical protein